MSNSITYRGPALSQLHGQFAKKHRIDEAAPIRNRREIVVNAPVHRVWQMLIDVPAWETNLEPGVKNVRLEHGVSVDATFTRSNKGARMRAQFAVVREDREIAWTGSAFGARVVHRFQLEAVGDKVTKVVVEESMSGPLLGLFFSVPALNELLDISLRTLKAAAEG